MNVVMKTPQLLVLRDSNAGARVAAAFLAAVGVLLLTSVLGLGVQSELVGLWPHLLVLAAAVGCLGAAAAVLVIPASEVRIDRKAGTLEIRRGRERYRAQFSDVAGIHVVSQRDADGDLVYRATVATAQWRQPVSQHWRADQAAVEAMAAEVRAFVSR